MLECDKKEVFGARAVKNISKKCLHFYEKIYIIYIQAVIGFSTLIRQ